MECDECLGSLSFQVSIILVEHTESLIFSRYWRIDISIYSSKTPISIFNCYLCLNLEGVVDRNGSFGERIVKGGFTHNYLVCDVLVRKVCCVFQICHL